IDDLDTPRVRPGADRAILRALEELGLWWNGEVQYQSPWRDHYQEAYERLRRDGRLFPCGCTRRELAGGPYPGTCRDGLPAGRIGRSWRFRLPEGPITIDDRIHGPRELDLADACGDFVVLRADGVHAYHLATVIDDARMGVTQVVRGADLLMASACQGLLQEALGLSRPDYAHLPLAVTPDGTKLSKREQSPAIDPGQPAQVLRLALDFLGHAPPQELDAAPASLLLEWALEHWELRRVPAVPSRPAPGQAGP
ncbi:MAG: tRNA glutamyl-Q(34) synthetase GluQRS, partial [Gammaproteobacteria bacterium]